MVQYLGVIVIAAWAINIWAFMAVYDARPGLVRLGLWALILLIPLVGIVAWYLLGPRAARR